MSASKPRISTHVLDVANGHPAEGISVELFRFEANSWLSIRKSSTGKDGRAADFNTGDTLEPGMYKFVFNIADYFQTKQMPSFFPKAEIVFETQSGQHYHIPLLLSPYSYTTYRGQ